VACASTNKTGTGLAFLRLLAAVLLALSVLPATAGEGVLVENIPANVDKAATLTVVRQALEHREWKIVGQDADSVSATISRQAIDAKIRITHGGTRLVYQESALGKNKLDHTGRWTPSTTATPDRWINYLRSDITENLMTRSASGPAAQAKGEAVAPGAGAATAAPPSAAVQRMQVLKEMYDKGLISAEEYGRKREEILKSL
jgi:hypothetical protein